MATDDPEGWDFFQKTHEHAAGDEDIKILNNLNNVGAIEVNAFQSQADVVLQKSIREGFGLTVSEALWKARPTIAGNVGGIPLQIQDGETGFLVNSPEEAAERCMRGPRRPRARQAARPRRQGVRPHAFPDAAPAARLAAGSSPTWPERRSRTRCVRLTAMERPLVLLSNRGPATFERDESGELVPRRGGGGLVTALTGLLRQRDALWIASAMTDEDVEVSRRHGERGFEVELDGTTYRIRLVASDPEAYDRFYNVIANPLLWFIQHYLWDLSNVPDIRLSERDAWERRLQARQRGPRASRARGDRGPRGADRDGPRLPPLHLPGDDPRASGRTPSSTTSSTSPGPQPDAWRVLPTDMRTRDLRGPARRTTSSASTRAPTATTSCSAAAS